MGIAAGIVMDGDEAGHAATLLIFAAHRVAGALGGDHDDVDGLLRFDQREVHVEAMGEGNGGAIADVGGDLVAVDVGLKFIRRRHHHEVAPLGGVGHGHHLEAIGFDFLRGGRTGLEGDGDILGAGVLQVQRMRPALAAIADDDDLLALDQINVGIPVIINAHGVEPLLKNLAGNSGGGWGWQAALWRGPMRR